MDPGGIRWIDQNVEKGSVRIPGIEYDYQHTFAPDEVTSTAIFNDGLREAQALYKPLLHQRMDGWARFERPRNGFVGLVLEMKSGNQNLHAPIFQLKCYREALRRRCPEPMVVWGIFERPLGEAMFERVAKELTATVASPARRDVWVLSTADEIPSVLEALGLTR